MYISGFKDIFEKVEEYNKKIESLISERKAYMDSVMERISSFKIGDEYVNVKTGEHTKIIEIYRMSSVGGRGAYFDDSIFDIHARFDNGDNTSRFGIEERNPYVKLSDYENKTDLYYKKLEDLVRYK